ncbi:acyl carrier protein [Segniliparus rugosus]|uniref:Carrier domain-containing protein n=1 Tax=Segniliparus rugosus (strain ATCC BAA-974 / DSM 45345 / CCUG 50838 / CIP 108380 / JCM 13579 / CDC 945) TaxID=679197 RepID=E5XKV6_SEGRC|nr:acyl carrier protein [Segniliparus rugosus]EFV15019.1 hypothetical protein HMPREF9336_00125 [Segniliparus rugosus ATCC BAA-974]
MDLLPAADDIALGLVYEALGSVATSEPPELSPDWEIADLGYDSVQILEALTQIEETVGVSLSQQKLIGVRTVGDLADVVRASLAGASETLVG